MYQWSITNLYNNRSWHQWQYPVIKNSMVCPDTPQFTGTCTCTHPYTHIVWVEQWAMLAALWSNKYWLTSVCVCVFISAYNMQNLEHVEITFGPLQSLANAFVPEQLIICATQSPALADNKCVWALVCVCVSMKRRERQRELKATQSAAVLMYLWECLCKYTGVGVFSKQ